ncbi:MAG: glycosyltransferase [Candidatus Auribacterota bacterium]|nr:glycosyltransferase [Candidatus Auribacterota bacterium]
MRPGDFINFFLNRIGLDLVRLSRKGPAERSRTPKAVFFTTDLKTPPEDWSLLTYWREAHQLLPGRLFYLSRNRNIRPELIRELKPPAAGDIDPRGAIWTPGDYAYLALPAPAEEMEPEDILPLLEGYLHAIGSGAIGCIFPIIPLTHEDDLTRSRIQLVLRRSQKIFTRDAEVISRIEETIGGPVAGLDQQEGNTNQDNRGSYREGDNSNLPRISLVTTCKGRLSQLQQTIEGCLQQNDPNYEYVVVDYDCPEGTAGWVKSRPDDRIVVVKIHNRHFFNQSHSRNLGARFATGEILVFIDADTILEPDFLSSVRKKLRGNSFLTTSMALAGEKDYGSGAGLMGYGGIIGCWKKDWEAIRGFDESMVGWGGEDDDFRRRLRGRGLTPLLFDLTLCQAMDHDENSRTEFYREQKKGRSSTLNRQRGENPLRPLSPNFGGGNIDSLIEISYLKKTLKDNE